MTNNEPIQATHRKIAVTVFGFWQRHGFQTKDAPTGEMEAWPTRPNPTVGAFLTQSNLYRQDRPKVVTDWLHKLTARLQSQSH